MEVTPELDEKTFQHACMLYLNKKLGGSHAKEILSLSSTLGVDIAADCKFNIESLLKPATEVTASKSTATEVTSKFN